MATLTERLPNNVSGRFYVDASCIDCDRCRDIAPQFFARDPDAGLSFVKRQPETPEEIAEVTQSMCDCAAGSIGDDGPT